MITTEAQPRELRVAFARDLGPMFVNNPHRMIGQDGAFSIPLEPGKTLWFFGDTLIGKRIAGQSLWYIFGQAVGHADMSGKGPFERMINNTGLILHHQRGADSLAEFDYVCDEAGQLRPLIPLEGDEHPDWDRIWCQHGICIDGKVVLSFIKVKMLDTSGPFPVNFEIVGSGLAVGSTSDWKLRRVTFRGDSILWKADEPHFATAFLDEGEFIYLYGTVKRGQTHQAFLARATRQGIGAVEFYAYLTSAAPTWGGLNDAIPLFDGMPSEMSVSWNEHLQSYLAVHSLDLTGKIVGRTAPNPWGPWSEPVVLWTVNVKRDKALPYPVVTYAGKEHPELAADGGRRIYLTYVEFEEYFPHLVEVSLA
jgi:Domain of unknown function (DUF4185)